MILYLSDAVSDNMSPATVFIAPRQCATNIVFDRKSSSGLDAMFHIILAMYSRNPSFSNITTG